MMKISKPFGLLIMIMFIIVAGTNNVSCQTSGKSMRKTEKKMTGSKRKTGRKAGAKESKTVTRTLKEQEKNEAKLKKEYEKSVAESRDRHYSIQTAEVQERMKQNEKDIKQRDRERKKKARKDARKPDSARKKYKN